MKFLFEISKTTRLTNLTRANTKMKFSSKILFSLLGMGATVQAADLVQPDSVSSSDGLLDITLTLEYAEHVSNPAILYTRLFNGTLPGPTLKVKAGDTMRIFFKNELEDQATQNTAENEYGYPDDSNLHFHGGHVSGELPSDDVTMSVYPGNSYQYETHFPDTHMPGYASDRLGFCSIVSRNELLTRVDLFSLSIEHTGFTLTFTDLVLSR